MKLLISIFLAIFSFHSYGQNDTVLLKELWSMDMKEQ